MDFPRASSLPSDSNKRQTDWRISNSLARAYAVCALSIGTSAAFFLTGIAPLPVLLYFPLRRRWAFGAEQTELYMDFYGRSLLALLAGLALGLSTYAVLRLMYVKAALRVQLPAQTGESSDLANVHEKRLSPSPSEACTEKSDLVRSSRLLLFTAYAASVLLLTICLFAYQLALRVPSPELLPAAFNSPT